MATIGQNNLEQQRTLVTGGTSGIGRAVALQAPAKAPRFSFTAATRRAAARRSPK